MAERPLDGRRSHNPVALLLYLRGRKERTGGLSTGGKRVASKMAKLPNSTDKHVGGRVRMRRMMLRMSQTALGDALGLSFQQVQKYEKGTNRIGAGRLQHIAHCLQVPIEFLFDGAPGEPIKENNPLAFDYVSDFLAMSDGLALMNAFTRLKDTAMRRRVLTLVEQISEQQRASVAP
jgi:transcriptional regulator with XRE-family HTH domain